MKRPIDLTNELLHEALAVERPLADEALIAAIRDEMAATRPRHRGVGRFGLPALQPAWLLVILALIALAGAAVGAGLMDQRRPRDLAFPATGPLQTARPSFDPFADGLEIRGITATAPGLAAADDSIGLAVDGRDRGFLRVDVATGQTALIPLPPGPPLVTPAVGPRYVWTAGSDEGNAVLYRVERSGNGTPDAFKLDVAVWSLGVDDEGQLWARNGDGAAVRLADDGGAITPVAVRGPDLPTYRRMVVPPAFGGLWAHAGDRVLRLDPADGSLLETVQLEECPPIPDSHHGFFHTGLLYPLRGAADVPDGIAVACWDLDDGGVQGPLSLIDPVTNNITSRFDVPRQRQPGAVVSGGWFVELDGRAIGRVDPVTGRVGAEIRLPRGSAVALAGAGGSLWTLVEAGPTRATLLRLPADRLP